MSKKDEAIYFKAVLKQTGKNALKIDAEGEAEITFTVSASELAAALGILPHGQAVLIIGVKPEDQGGKATLAALYDDKVGGFFATVPDATSAIIATRKPLEANGTAASFYYDLSVYTKDETYKTVATRTVRAVAQPEIIRNEGKITGEFAIALEKVTTAYVEFSVVGDTNHLNSKALFEAGRDVFEPRKLLHYEEPGRYPDRGKPVMYICNPDMCSLPIEDPATVATQAAAFSGPAISLNLRPVQD